MEWSPSRNGITVGNLITVVVAGVVEAYGLLLSKNTEGVTMLSAIGLDQDPAAIQTSSTRFQTTVFTAG